MDIRPASSLQIVLPLAIALQISNRLDPKMTEEIPLDLQVAYLDENFSHAAVTDSILALSSSDSVERSLKMIMGAKLTHPDEDASSFWFELMTIITVTETQAIFCPEEAVATKLTARAQRRLTAAYMPLFRRAGLIVRNDDHIFQLVRDVYSRQLKPEGFYTNKKNAAFAAVLAATTSTSDMQLWISALEELMQAQRMCRSSPPNDAQIREVVLWAVERFHNQLAMHSIWTLPSIDTQDIITWLRGFCHTPFTASSGEANRHDRPFCKICRARHVWGQHVSEPTATSRDGARGARRTQATGRGGRR